MESYIGDSGVAEVRKDATSPVNNKDSLSGQVHTYIQNLSYTRVVAATGSASSSSLQGSGSLMEEESESGKAQEIFRTLQSQLGQGASYGSTVPEEQPGLPGKGSCIKLLG